MTDSRTRLDLHVLLPEIGDARDACARRLVNGLEAQDGISLAHVVDDGVSEESLVCIHYDPDMVSLSRVRRLAETAGAHLTQRYGHVAWSVRGLLHERRARSVRDRLQQVTGILEVQVHAGGPIRIEFDRDETDETALREVIAKVGLVPTDRADAPARNPTRSRGTRDGRQGTAAIDRTGADPAHDHDHDQDQDREHEHSHGHGGLLGERAELAFAALACVCVAIGWLLSAVAPSWVAATASWLPTTLFGAAYFFGGFFTLREAWESIRGGRFEIDFLMLVAAAGAAALGEWFEGGLLLALFSIGHSLEHHAMGRARRAIESLADLTPDTAVVRRDGADREIPVDRLEVGDRVMVRTNERIPADGFIARGAGSVDQAPVTGESIPVDKEPVADVQAASDDPDALDARNRVFAGTLNGTSALEIVVTRRSSESTLARVVQLVTEAEAERSPTERFTARFERVFVPVVLGFVVLLLFAWLVVDESFGASFYRAMAVLVAASPCALAIATPSAVLSGIARAGRGGVLVKGGGPLEHLGALGALAFDKTGTLTEGRPRVTDVEPDGDANQEELLRTAVAVESASDHPLAKAVVRHGMELVDDTTTVDEVESVTGLGVRATLGGEPVAIGKPALFDSIGGPPPPSSILDAARRLESGGRTTMVVRRGDRYLGVIGLMDELRPTAAAALKRLRELGVERMVLLSGDNQRVVDAVARELGIDEAKGDLLPEEKVDMVRELSRDAKTAMVGDGVNDAPALAQATVGIAMGAAGSDVALETADVALMADDLSHLPFVIGLSRRTASTIRQNLWISLGMVALLVPATVLGLGIGPAVALHEGSTLIVVVNALRLLAYRDVG